MSSKENRSKSRSLMKIEPLNKNEIDVDSYITKEFDYVVKSDLYRAKTGTEGETKCFTYDLVRNISLDEKNKMVRPIITLSSDIAISSATLSGSAERHLIRSGVTQIVNGEKMDGIDFSTELCVLFISSGLHMYTNTYETFSDYRASTMSNAMGLCDMTNGSFTNHRVNLDPKNVIYLGIKKDHIDTSEQNILEAMNIKPTLFTLEDIDTKGLDRIMKYVSKKFNDKKIHVVFDLASLKLDLAPATNRFDSENKGLCREDVSTIMKYVVSFNENSQLEAFDLVNYNFSTTDKISDNNYKDLIHSANNITSKIMLDILKCICDFKERSVNIFNDESKFLIWRKIPNVSDLFNNNENSNNDTDNDMDNDTDNLTGSEEQIDPVGWYILRGMDIEMRNAVIEHFEKLKKDNEDKGKDNEDKEKNKSDKDDISKRLEELEYPIERFEIKDGDEIIDTMISVTSPAEQNLKSYLTAQSFLERCLVPGEKVNMTFELLATPAAINSLNKEAIKSGEYDNIIMDDDLHENHNENNNDEDKEYYEMLQEYNNCVKNSK